MDGCLLVVRKVRHYHRPSLVTGVVLDLLIVDPRIIPDDGYILEVNTPRVFYWLSSATVCWTRVQLLQFKVGILAFLVFGIGFLWAFWVRLFGLVFLIVELGSILGLEKADIIPSPISGNVLKVFADVLQVQFVLPLDAHQAQVPVCSDDILRFAILEEHCVGEDQLTPLYFLGVRQQVLHQPVETAVFASKALVLLVDISHLQPLFNYF